MHFVLTIIIKRTGVYNISRELIYLFLRRQQESIMPTDSSPNTKVKTYCRYGAVGISCLLFALFAVAVVMHLHGRFSFGDVNGYVRAGFAVGLILTALLIRFAGNKKIPFILCVAILFFIYGLRAPDDLFTSYLWAEDGADLIQGSVFDGIKTIWNSYTGFYWVLPRTVGLLCYYICLYTNTMANLPMIQGLVTKLIAVLGISYFLNDRFEWLIKERAYRLLVCILVILAMPCFASDVITCDLSMPFVLNFTVFLIGLDTLCGPKARCITVPEALFLCVLAMSNAAAPFAAAVAAGALVRYLAVNIKSKSVARKELATGITGTCLVIICSVVQILRIMHGSRAGNELALWDRLITCLRNFIFFPYCSGASRPAVWTVLCLGCIALAYLSGIPKKTAAFTVAYNYAFIFFCSMVTSMDRINEVVFGENDSCGRYIFVMYMLSAFLLGVEAYFLIRKKLILKMIGFVLCALLAVMSVATYSIDVIGYEYTYAYEENIGLFTPDGTDRLMIQIGPWLPQRLMLPAELSDHPAAQGGTDCRLDPVNYQPGASDFLTGWEPYHQISGTAATNDRESFEYILLDLGNGIYQTPLALGVHPNSVDDDDSFGILRKDGFIFRVEESYLNSGTLHFVGITEQGEQYRWDVEIPPVSQLS